VEGVAPDNVPYCKEFVDKGYCQTRPKYMKQQCQTSCAEWVQSKEQAKVVNIENNDRSFYELSAVEAATGETFHFSRLEDYVTVVINMSKMCSSYLPKREQIEDFLSQIEAIRTLNQYALEVLVFPFINPKMMYPPDQDCSMIEEAMMKTGRSIRIMRPVKINGEKTHRVYKWLKEKVDVKDLEEDVGTFFVVDPDGKQLDYHVGISMNYFMDVLRHKLRAYDEL